MLATSGTSTFAFEALGVSWEIETEKPLDEALRVHILGRAECFDSVYSRFRRDSLVARIARATDGGRFEFPDDSVALFDLYDRLHAATDGAVDPLIGRDLELLGYDRNYSLTPAANSVRNAYARERPIWSRDVVRERPSLITRRALVIDIGALGKGYLVDVLCATLLETGITGFVIDGGGDIRHAGSLPVRIGLEDPFNGERVIGVANLCGRALCASGINRRAWGAGWHHVLDARTGLPIYDVVATWAIADDAMTADGIATALFFVPAEGLANSFACSAVRMFSDRRAERLNDDATRTGPARFICNPPYKLTALARKIATSH
jgi:thiamine biosynthesis lipoprotein